MSFHFDKVLRWVPALFLWVVLGTTASGAGTPVILAFGDSLTAGFGVNEESNYPSRLQDILQKAGYPHRVINAGVSGDTTAGGVRRINWLLKHSPEIVIVELGANDGLRGLPLDAMEQNLDQIIRACKEKGAKVILAGMKVPPNMGEDYSKNFEQVFPRLAKQYHTGYIPFFLENVAARKDLTQPDGIHPLADGYKIVADTVWRYLQPMLNKSKSDTTSASKSPLP
jgi:acyl-CoA thioesterase-1